MASINLLIQTAFIGDLLLTIPLIKKIRERYPEHDLALLCRKGLGSFFLEAGLVHQIFEVDKNNRESWEHTDQQLKEISFDRIISPHESFRSAKIAASLRANRKIGYKKWWNFWAFDQRVERKMIYPESLRQLFLLYGLDKDGPADIKDQLNVQLDQLALTSKSYLEPDLTEPIPAWASMSLAQWINEEDPEIQKIRQQMVPKIGTKPLAFFAPGSTWNTKCWTPSGYIELGKKLTKENFQVVILGAPNEKEMTEKISHLIPTSINLVGQTTLMESYLLLRQGALLVCNDNGAMHLGAAAEIPTVALFGPTVLSLGYRPWQNRAVIVEKPVDCRPCGKHGHKKCPIGTHICMKSITADDVIQSITTLSHSHSHK